MISKANDLLLVVAYRQLGRDDITQGPRQEYQVDVLHWSIGKKRQQKLVSNQVMNVTSRPWPPPAHVCRYILDDHNKTTPLFLSDISIR